MKKIILAAFGLALATGAYAQIDVVKAAERAMKDGSDAAQVVELITPAMTNPETATLAQTWYVPGKASYGEYDRLLGFKHYRIHSITPNNAIYDVTSTSCITSHPCIRHCNHCICVITTYPLISHPLLNDITPTFCVTSYALYRTSHPIIMSSLYCTYDITTYNYETTSSM